jgi:hypothetical protein
VSAQILQFPPRQFVGVDLGTGPSYTVRHCPALPIVLHQHQGAVELLIGCSDGDVVELWVSGQQSISLGEDLIRLGRLALAAEQEATP